MTIYTFQSHNGVAVGVGTQPSEALANALGQSIATLVIDHVIGGGGTVEFIDGKTTLINKDKTIMGSYISEVIS